VMSGIDMQFTSWRSPRRFYSHKINWHLITLATIVYKHHIVSIDANTPQLMMLFSISADQLFKKRYLM